MNRTLDRPGDPRDLVPLMAACALALLLRCLGYSSVFPQDGGVVLGIDDAQFHARRALYSFVNFPAVLHFDWFLAYPDGAPAPVPPLFEWATAAVARLFGGDVHTLETAAAWVSPVAGALLVWPAYAIGCSVASRGVGLTAAWLTAILPSGILITRLGNFDHHGVVALIAACWLALSLSSVGRSGPALATRAALLACVVALMLFTWSGSLLYLALGTAAQLGPMLLLHGRPERLVAVGASLLGAALPTTLWLANSPAPLGGPFSSRTLSWLHLLALLSIGGATLLLAAWERRRPSRGPAVRLLRLALLAGAAGLPLLAFPALREQFLEGLLFVSQQDAWAATNPEQLPLFHATAEAATATARLGFFAYLVPLLPLYLGWRVARSAEREKLGVLWVWVSALSLLLLSQLRYGTDFTVPGAVTFAMILLELRRWLSRRLRARVAVGAAVTLGAIGLLPAVTGVHQPAVSFALARLFGDPEAGETRRTPREIGVLFGRRVRELTPEVGGFLEPEVRPEYGVLVPPHLGHRFTYTARRPVPSNNFGPYLDPEKYRLARTFYRSRGRRQAMGILDALDVRYVVTIARDRKNSVFADHLHTRNESSVGGVPATGRFRLVDSFGAAEATSRAPDGSTRTKPERAFKLFEIVEGAVLVVDAEADGRVWAEIELVPREGPPVVYRTLATTDADDVARLRVPYATRREGPVATPGPWWVRAGDRKIPYEVGEADVREGREVRAPAAERQ